MAYVEPTSKQIEDLRRRFLTDVKSRGESAVHPADLNRVVKNDDWLRRFLLHQELNENNALQMIWDTVQWRKEWNVNDINESNVNMEYLKEGGFFCHGRAKDGSLLFIFKGKKHVKGLRDTDDIKRCVIYWMERMERQENGKPITIFFDMEACGLSNVDMELTKYLINLFKLYYPWFLSYILIYEMAWILNAVFKLIKTWLPEKAVEKIKFLKKDSLKEYVDPDQALKCWGGSDNYSFVFVPESEESVASLNSMNNKKVHFADGSPASDSGVGFADKDQIADASSMLRIQPSGIITFYEGDEPVSTLVLQNTDSSTIISYKMKTTSPEKFRVRPSVGILVPGAQATVTVTLLNGYQIGGLSRDKFLVMSMPVDNADLSAAELSELWKNMATKNVSQHRLRCALPDSYKNGSAMVGSSSFESDSNQLSAISDNIASLNDCQAKLQGALRRTQMLQWLTMALVLVLGVAMFYVWKTELSADQVCHNKYDVHHNEAGDF